MKTLTFKYFIQASTLQPVLVSPALMIDSYCPGTMDSHGLVEIFLDDSQHETVISVKVSGDHSKDRDADIIKVFGSLINNTNRRYYYE